MERRTGKLERNADHLQSTYEDLEDQTNTKFEQTANSISAEVDRAQKAEGQLDASLELKLGRDENDQVVSMINASADQIVLRGNRLIVECSNFELDALGRAHIVDSLLFDSGDAYGVEILGHDGRNNALLQNVMLDLSSVTDANGDAIGDHASTADYATTAGSATTAESAERARECVNASIAYYLQGIGISDYVHISGNGNLIPSSSSVYCGTNPNPFAGGYSSGGWKTTSDRRKKKDFRKLLEDDRFERFFELLQPMKYRLIENDDKMHIGFVAQDVEQAMTDCGISENEFYGLEHAVLSEKDFESNEEWEKFLEQNGGANDMYTLCYQEFIALNTAMIQKLQNRCNDFERRLSALERKWSDGISENL